MDIRAGLVAPVKDEPVARRRPLLRLLSDVDCSVCLDTPADIHLLVLPYLKSETWKVFLSKRTFAAVNGTKCHSRQFNVEPLFIAPTDEANLLT